VTRVKLQTVLWSQGSDNITSKEAAERPGTTSSVDVTASCQYGYFTVHNHQHYIHVHHISDLRHEYFAVHP
jgi:hypothetical protein